MDPMLASEFLNIIRCIGLWKKETNLNEAKSGELSVGVFCRRIMFHALMSRWVVGHCYEH
jgi:hypothetical protein